MKRARAAVALTAVFVLTVAGTALASHFTDNPFDADSTGVDWAGTWEWYGSAEAHGGWHFWGTLVDLGCEDDDNVYSKVRVESYSPNSFYGDEKCDGVGDDQEFQNYEVWDPQATTTREAEYWACRDRNAPYADNCSDENNHFTR